MSYTPNGLFNHTAAIYQMMTGYTTDKVSPSGQLEPPDPRDFPNFGSNIIKMNPMTEPMLPFVIVTYHPVTLLPGKAEEEVRALLQALGSLPGGMQLVFTGANADPEGSYNFV